MIEMNKSRVKELGDKGFKVGTVEDFLDDFDVRPFFVPIHNVDIPLAKFKINELVRYRYYDIELEDYFGLETKVIAVNYMCDDDLGPIIEYALEDSRFLVYENELEIL